MSWTTHNSRTTLTTKVPIASRLMVQTGSQADFVLCDTVELTVMHHGEATRSSTESGDPLLVCLRNSVPVCVFTRWDRFKIVPGQTLTNEGI